MIYYKTFYIGTEDTNEIVDTDDIILFDDRNVWCYAELATTLSNEYSKTAIQHFQNVRTGPRKVKLLMTDSHASGIKCNPENTNTSIETVEWFLNNMYPPPGGMIISIYFYKNMFPNLCGIWTAQTIWPFKRQWIGDGDYITVQRITPTSSQNKHNMARELGHQKLIDNIETYSPYPVKYVSYKNGEEDTLEKLIHSKRHFTYMAGTYFFAQMVNVPSVCYGYPIGQSIEVLYSEKFDKKAVRTDGSLWGGNDGLGKGQILHFDIEKQRCIQKPQTYIKHCQSKEELFDYITFNKELEISHRNKSNWTDISDLNDWKD